MKIIDYISYKVIPLLTGEEKKPNVYITHKNYLNWYYLNNSMKKSIPYIKGKCIDIGSGNSPYKKYIIENVDEYISVDKGDIHRHMLGTSKEQFFDADIKDLPFEDNSFDTIILTQVLEHIDEPTKALDEVKRVLKKNGVIIISVPFIYQSHAIPYDFFRYSEYSLRKICKDYNYKILEFHYQGYFGTAIFSMINAFIWEFAGKQRWLRNTIGLPLFLIVFTINNVLGRVLDKIKAKNFTPNFWLDLQNK